MHLSLFGLPSFSGGHIYQALSMVDRHI